LEEVHEEHSVFLESHPTLVAAAGHLHQLRLDGALRWFVRRAVFEVAFLTRLLIDLGVVFQQQSIVNQ
jgi:hypothetical protein